MTTKLERIFKVVGGRIKTRSMDPQMKKVMKDFQCMFCCDARATEQLASRYGRRGKKIVPASWYWICEDCMEDLLNMKKSS